MTRLDDWLGREMRRSHRDVDPLWTVMREGGPLHANFNGKSFDLYVERLRKTGRSAFADDLLRRKAELK